MSRCLTLAGFEPKTFNPFAGLSEIVKFKVLKTLHVRSRHQLIDILPWRLIAKVVDAKYKVSEMPYGVAIGR
jgi:hypothetical protein